VDVFSDIFSKTFEDIRFTPQLFPFAYQATAALLQTSLELLHGLAVCHALGASEMRGNEEMKGRNLLFVPVDISRTVIARML